MGFALNTMQAASAVPLARETVKRASLEARTDDDRGTAHPQSPGPQRFQRSARTEGTEGAEVTNGETE
jgi:hypothetical protein